MHTMKCKSQSEMAPYCIIPTSLPSGKGKTMETVKKSVVTRHGGWGGRNRQSTEDFYGGNTLYDTIMVDTCHYTFA